MAIFASTTLGSSDPSRAQSIKALEARAQALAAAQAKQEAPTSLPSPWQGAGLVMNQAADAFATKRADQAAAEQRQQLQALMGQVGPEGPNPQQLAGITTRDPEFGKMYAQQAFQARQDAVARQAQKEMATQKAQQDREYLAEQDRLGQAHPQTDQGKVKADVASGRMTPEEGAAALKKLNAGPVSEQKFLADQKTESMNHQSTLATLDTAEALLNDPVGIHAGPQAGNTQGIGENVPGFVQSAIPSVLPDPKKTENTQLYNQIMGGQALALLTQMKGASSDKDVAINFKIVNDPNATIANKRIALGVLKTKLAAYLKMNNDIIAGAGGEVPVLPQAGGAAAPAPGGGGAPAGAGVQSVASEAEALALPSGTRFKLPDGRTGTAR